MLTLVSTAEIAIMTSKNLTWGLERLEDSLLPVNEEASGLTAASK